MIRVAAFLMMLAGATAAFAQSEPTTVEVSYPKHTYRSERCVFTEHQFKNMRVSLLPGGDHGSDHGGDNGKMVDGRFLRPWVPGLGSSEAWFRWAYFVQEKGAQHAIALYSWQWTGASSSHSDVVQVFDCENGRLRIVQQIIADTHGSERAGADFDPRSRALEVRSVRVGASGRCCPKHLDIARFQWIGARFRQREFKTVDLPARRVSEGSR